MDKKIDKQKVDELLERSARLEEIENNLTELYRSPLVANALRVKNLIRKSRNLSLRILRYGISKSGTKFTNLIRKSRNLFLRVLRYGIRKAGIKYLKLKISENNKKWEGPLVTVITTFYNQSETINETIESVLAQSFGNFEYLVVNDGSKEEERKVLDAIKDKRLKVIDIKHSGFGSPAPARNEGLKRAKGKYVMCLDGDDMLEPTYLEKTVSVLETNHNVDIVGTDMKMFGDKDSDYSFRTFNAQRMLRQNFFIHASLFRASLLEKVEGFKAGIGYEDWEFWINLVEEGAGGFNLNEKLFLYRVVPGASRYKDDIKKHRENFLKIASMHRFYRVKVLISNIKRSVVQKKVKPKTAFLNLGEENLLLNKNGRKQVLIAMPWMTFGGAETLVHNFTFNLKKDHDFHFITGIKSENAWEYKFREVTESIYHLPYLFEDDQIKLSFVLNFIKTRKIDIMHIVHNACFYKMLPEIKKMFPELKIIHTLFNTRADHFKICQNYDRYFNFHTSDNTVAIKEMKMVLGGDDDRYETIPNGVDCFGKFDRSLYNRGKMRAELGLENDECAVFSIGRLSKEKGPDKFVEIASKVLKDNQNKVKFFITGDGPMKGEIEEQISKLKVSGLKYLGYKSNPENYLAASDIFLLTSEIEGFPLSNIEAMAMKNVVVSSDVGGVSDAIVDGSGGYLVEYTDVSKFTKIIGKLIKDKPLRDKISENARKSVEEKYSVSILAENYKKLYSK